MRNMLFVVPAAAGLAFMGTAHAADAPIYEVVPDAVVYQEMASSWDGFYAGIHGGYATGNFNSTVVGGIDPPFDAEGYLFGGQVGYDIQNGNFVFGVVADASFTTIDGTVCICMLGQHSAEVDWLATVRGRVGYAMGSFLPYITGGAAFAGITTSLVGVSDEAVHTGWTAGGGVEYALGNGLTLGAEYLYVDLGEERYTYGVTMIDTELELHIARANLNYRFNY